MIKVISALLLFVGFAATAQPVLEKIWESDTTMRTPESVLYHKASKRLFVSNIDGQAADKDGKGFISVLNLDGTVGSLHFMDGLDAPKGMAVVKDKLYVTDITRLVVFDINSGRKLNVFDVAGSEFLNDATADDKGNIYFSDSRNGTLYKLAGEKVEVCLKDTLLKNPNGLYCMNENLMAVDFKTGIYYRINPQNKKLTKVAEGFPSGDGIEPIGNGAWLMSSWPGELRHLDKNNKITLILDTKSEKISCADIGYNADQKVVYVPTFFKNKVVAYRLL